jgi:hypothetical protein
MGLPAELRDEIWSHCWQPRIVEVHPYTNDDIQDKTELFSSDTYRSTAKPPITLFICRQSRIDTLRCYKLSFAAYQKEAQVYFNFQIDELYVKHAELGRFKQFFLMFPHEDLSKIRNLRIEDKIMQRIFNASACHSPRDLPRWIREKDPMTGLFGLKTLIVQRELPSPIQSRDACVWTLRYRLGGVIVRDPPWEKVFEYLGEGTWPTVSAADHQGALQYSEIHWHNLQSLHVFCCRPNLISTLKSL